MGLYRYTRRIDYLASLPGVDIERDVLKIVIEHQDLALLTALARSYDNVDTLMRECEEGQQIRTIWSYYWYEEAIQCQQ